MRNRTADLFFDPDTAAPVCGVDEAGRGPLAGPVVAAAVILRPEVAIAGLADSKTLATAERERLYAQIVAGALVGVGAASVAEIDRLNILNATLLAMQRAVGRLPQPPAHALIDGNRPPRLAMPATCIVGGDASEPAIAAASIIAKVTRDRIMHTLAHIHRGYGWETNVGYPTAAHRAALLHLGITRHHRRSFRPVRLVAEPAVTL